MVFTIVFRAAALNPESVLALLLRVGGAGAYAIYEDCAELLEAGFPEELDPST